MIHVQLKTVVLSLISEAFVAVAVLSEFDTEVRRVAGILGIALACITIYKIWLEVKLKRMELKEKEKDEVE